MGCEAQLALEAQEELAAIVDYLVTTANAPTAAVQLLAALDELLDRIEERPGLYPLSQDPHLAQLGYRKAVVGSYIALYRMTSAGPVVGHIFHGKQDYAKLV